ncbi:DUF802 domain-containing protein [Luteibacter sp. 329MFSha]|uniref:DUF802 domain-containing protein n=1 Tax=Luteibacter sp. 329MFSha TaxID=1798239 RepID=UPI0008AEF33E|nr:DUF802 domain-containing protein [Luteibacter sp. 329MFSha]SEW28118.1 protein of unknown function [Luteibacter sp. 329MFSha]
MFRNLLYLFVFVVGLAVVAWIGIGYVGSNPLGAAIAALIGVCYVAGALELFRYRQATGSLGAAVGELSGEPPSLAAWVGRLHPSLRQTVRLRVEGERVALPPPVLTPYLVGLLVLLGMLGTLLGMMATLHGTGLALESATDLQAIRNSLAAPVKGLGFAFGTSIAGVASSAMLGLLSALCRRERVAVVQQLDAAIATTLRVHSRAHQREESFRLLQRQSEAMPALVDRLQAMIEAIERQGTVTGERQLASQETFQAKTEAIHQRLAAAVEQSLRESVVESARAAGAAFQPVVDTTMAALARETTALHEAINASVKRQLEGLSTGFEAAATQVSSIWTDALAAQRAANDELVRQQRDSHEALTRELAGTLEAFGTTFGQRSATLVDNVTSRLDATGAAIAEGWGAALSQQQAANRDAAARSEQALAQAAATFERHAASLVEKVDATQLALQETLQARDDARLDAWTGAFTRMGDTLGEQWAATGDATVARQQAICDAFESTAKQVAAQAQASASETVAEISRLLDAASEAPKVAAEVVAELRQKLSDSMLRDTAMLEERTRLLATLETLLDAVNHASTEQRTAVDALVAQSAELLDRVGTRFTDHIEAQTGKLETVAAQVSEGASGIAGLGEALGAAVASFGEANGVLTEHLQQVASALDKSMARSDEQLAYYVAQAREVVDLSMLSQKQIVEDLQRLASQRDRAGAGAA